MNSTYSVKHERTKGRFPSSVGFNAFRASSRSKLRLGHGHGVGSIRKPTNHPRIPLPTWVPSMLAESGMLGGSHASTSTIINYAEKRNSLENNRPTMHTISGTMLSSTPSGAGGELFHSQSDSNWLNSGKNTITGSNDTGLTGDDFPRLEELSTKASSSTTGIFTHSHKSISSTTDNNKSTSKTNNIDLSTIDSTIRKSIENNSLDPQELNKMFFEDEKIDLITKAGPPPITRLNTNIVGKFTTPSANTNQSINNIPSSGSAAAVAIANRVPFAQTAVSTSKERATATLSSRNQMDVRAVAAASASSLTASAAAASNNVLRHPTTESIVPSSSTTSSSNTYSRAGILGSVLSRGTNAEFFTTGWAAPDDDDVILDDEIVTIPTNSQEITSSTTTTKNLVGLNVEDSSCGLNFDENIVFSDEDDGEEIIKTRISLMDSVGGGVVGNNKTLPTTTGTMMMNNPMMIQNDKVLLQQHQQQQQHAQQWSTWDKSSILNSGASHHVHHHPHPQSRGGGGGPQPYPIGTMVTGESSSIGGGLCIKPNSISTATSLMTGSPVSPYSPYSTRQLSPPHPNSHHVPQQPQQQQQQQQSIPPPSMGTAGPYPQSHQYMQPYPGYNSPHLVPQSQPQPPPQATNYPDAIGPPHGWYGKLDSPTSNKWPPPPYPPHPSQQAQPPPPPPLHHHHHHPNHSHPQHSTVKAIPSDSMVAVSLSLPPQPSNLPNTQRYSIPPPAMQHQQQQQQQQPTGSQSPNSSDNEPYLDSGHNIVSEKTMKYWSAIENAYQKRHVNSSHAKSTTSQDVPDYHHPSSALNKFPSYRSSADHFTNRNMIVTSSTTPAPVAVPTTSSTAAVEMDMMREFQYLKLQGTGETESTTSFFHQVPSSHQQQQHHQQQQQQHESHNIINNNHSQQQQQQHGQSARSLQGGDVVDKRQMSSQDERYRQSMNNYPILDQHMKSSTNADYSPAPGRGSGGGGSMNNNITTGNGGANALVGGNTVGPGGYQQRHPTKSSISYNNNNENSNNMVRSCHSPKASYPPQPTHHQQQQQQYYHEESSSTYPRSHQQQQYKGQQQQQGQVRHSSSGNRSRPSQAPVEEITVKKSQIRSNIRNENNNESHSAHNYQQQQQYESQRSGGRRQMDKVKSNEMKYKTETSTEYVGAGGGDAIQNEGSTRHSVEREQGTSSKPQQQQPQQQQRNENVAQFEVMPLFSEGEKLELMSANSELRSKYAAMFLGGPPYSSSSARGGNNNSNATASSGSASTNANNPNSSAQSSHPHQQQQQQQHHHHQRWSAAQHQHRDPNYSKYSSPNAPPAPSTTTARRKKYYPSEDPSSLADDLLENDEQNDFVQKSHEQKSIPRGTRTTMKSATSIFKRKPRNYPNNLINKNNDGTHRSSAGGSGGGGGISGDHHLHHHHHHHLSNDPNEVEEWETASEGSGDLLANGGNNSIHRPTHDADCTHKRSYYRNNHPRGGGAGGGSGGGGGSIFRRSNNNSASGERSMGTRSTHSTGAPNQGGNKSSGGRGQGNGRSDDNYYDNDDVDDYNNENIEVDSTGGGTVTTTTISGGNVKVKPKLKLDTSVFSNVVLAESLPHVTEEELLMEVEADGNENGFIIGSTSLLGFQEVLSKTSKRNRKRQEELAAAAAAATAAEIQKKEAEKEKNSSLKSHQQQQKRFHSSSGKSKKILHENLKTTKSSSTRKSSTTTTSGLVNNVVEENNHRSTTQQIQVVNKWLPQSSSTSVAVVAVSEAQRNHIVPSVTTTQSTTSATTTAAMATTTTTTASSTTTTTKNEQNFVAIDKWENELLSDKVSLTNSTLPVDNNFHSSIKETNILSMSTTVAASPVQLNSNNSTKQMALDMCEYIVGKRAEEVNTEGVISDQLQQQGLPQHRLSPGASAGTNICKVKPQLQTPIGSGINKSSGNLIVVDSNIVDNNVAVSTSGQSISIGQYQQQPTSALRLIPEGSETITNTSAGQQRVVLPVSHPHHLLHQQQQQHLLSTENTGSGWQMMNHHAATGVDQSFALPDHLHMMSTTNTAINTNKGTFDNSSSCQPIMDQQYKSTTLFTSQVPVSFGLTTSDGGGGATNWRRDEMQHRQFAQADTSSYLNTYHHNFAAADHSTTLGGMANNVSSTAAGVANSSADINAAINAMFTSSRVPVGMSTGTAAPIMNPAPLQHQHHHQHPSSQQQHPHFTSLMQSQSRMPMMPEDSIITSSLQNVFNGNNFQQAPISGLTTSNPLMMYNTQTHTVNGMQTSIHPSIPYGLNGGTGVGGHTVGSQQYNSMPANNDPNTLFHAASIPSASATSNQHIYFSQPNLPNLSTIFPTQQHPPNASFYQTSGQDYFLGMPPTCNNDFNQQQQQQQQHYHHQQTQQQQQQRCSTSSSTTAGFVPSFASGLAAPPPQLSHHHNHHPSALTQAHQNQNVPTIAASIGNQVGGGAGGDPYNVPFSAAAAAHLYRGAFSHAATNPAASPFITNNATNKMNLGNINNYDKTQFNNLTTSVEQQVHFNQLKATTELQQQLWQQMHKFGPVAAAAAQALLPSPPTVVSMSMASGLPNTTISTGGGGGVPPSQMHHLHPHHVQLPLSLPSRPAGIITSTNQIRRPGPFNNSNNININNNINNNNNNNYYNKNFMDSIPHALFSVKSVASAKTSSNNIIQRDFRRSSGAKTTTTTTSKVNNN